MAGVKVIVIWSAVAILSAIAGGLIASRKNRHASSWAAWGFVFPPALIILLLLPRNRGPLLPRPSVDDEDRRMEMH